MFLIIARTAKESLSNFWRNGWLSIASAIILSLSLFALGVLFIVSKAGKSSIEKIQSKVNISIYLKSDVSSERAMEIKSELEKNDLIKSVDYITKEKALEDFKKNNANEPVIIKSLDEIGDNPLLASLVVTAKSNDSYDSLAETISNANFREDVSRINYSRVKEYIEKLNSSTQQIEKFWTFLVIIFFFISILIIFNTVRITIYTHREEIEVMRLVGASNTYIRLPFLFEGIICAFASTIISMALLLGYVKYLSHQARTDLPIPLFFGEQNLLSVYISNFILIFAFQFISATFLGILSSMIAMRKYLKI